MATWDVFHAERLEVERGLSSAEVRAALAKGNLRDDDLIRAAGSSVPWTPIADFAELNEPEADVPASAFAKTEESDELGFPEDDEEEVDAIEFPEEIDPALDDLESLEVIDDDEEEYAEDAALSEAELVRSEVPFADVELGRNDLQLADDESLLALPVGESEWQELDEEYDPQDEDEEAAEFTLSRGGPERVEELDLAAMVDVAFQLVLFFLVTATTVLYKSLEVPKPNPDSPAAGAAQGRSRTMDDLKNDYILVEIDPAGAMKIDREPVAGEMNVVVERLRSARANTKRQAMLLSADFATPHRNAVLAYDAANEIGLGIAIARPSPPADSPKPAPASAAKKTASTP